MKKLMTVFVSVLFSVSVFAQADKAAPQTQPAPAHHDMHHDMKNCVMMQDGKMMMMKDGKTMPMTADMKMSNGTTCAMNGECMMADGKKMMMKNGDCMDMSGMMMPNTMGKGNMKKTTPTSEPKKEAGTKEQ